MVSIPLSSKVASTLYKALCTWKCPFTSGSFSKTEASWFVIRPDNKRRSLYTNQEGYCIQIWVEKPLLTVRAFRVFTWKERESSLIWVKNDISGDTFLSCTPFQYCWLMLENIWKIYIYINYRVSWGIVTPVEFCFLAVERSAPARSLPTQWK